MTATDWGHPGFMEVNLVETFGIDNTGGSAVGAKINAALLALSLLTTSGQVARLPFGTYLIDQPIVVPDGMRVRGSGAAGTILKSNMAPLGSQTNCIFRRSPVAPASPNVGTIHTAPVIGATSVDVDLPNAPVAGNIIQLGNPGSGCITGQFFTMGTPVHVSGTHYTIPLDRPIVYPFTSGGTSTAQEWVSIPTDIHISDMTLTGTGDRWGEFIGALNCSAERVVMNGSGGAINDSGWSWDIGSRNCFYRDVTADVSLGVGGGELIGLLIESGENCHGIGCSARGGSGGGSSFLLDGYGSAWWNCKDDGKSTYGFVFGQGGGLGAINCEAHNCSATSALSSAGAGFNANLTTNLRLFGPTYTGDGTVGNAMALIVSGSAFGTKITGMTADGCSYQIANIANDVVIDGLYGTTIAGGINAINITGGAIVRISDFRPVFKTGTGSNVINVEASFTGRFELSHSDLTHTSASNNLVYCQGGTTVLDCVKSTGAGGSCTGVTSSGASTIVKMGLGCDFTSTATPLTVAAGGVLTQIPSGNLYTDATTTGTVTLTHVQAQSSAYKFAQSLTGNTAYNTPAGVPGVYVIDASGVTLNGHTLTFGPSGGTVSLTAAQHLVYSDGTNAHTVV